MTTKTKAKSKAPEQEIMRKIQFDDATKEELIKFASENLGMKLHPNTGLHKVAAAVRQAWRPDHIILYGPLTPEPEDTTAVVKNTETGRETVKSSIRALRGGSSENDPKVRMFLNHAEGQGGQRPVFVSVNNVAMLIPRGEEILVPYRYYLALRSAVATLYEQDEETFDMISREVPAYPFQVVEMPPPAEMVRWNVQELESQYPPGDVPYDVMAALYPDGEVPSEKMDSINGETIPGDVAETISKAA